MKKTYNCPIIEIENFISNEYVATCSKIYKCNAETSSKNYDYLFMPDGWNNLLTPLVYDHRYRLIENITTNRSTNYKFENGKPVYFLKCSDANCNEYITSLEGVDRATLGEQSTSTITDSAYAWVDTTSSTRIQDGKEYPVYYVHANDGTANVS